MRPALRWEQFIERLFALARDGHTDKRGMPDPTLITELLHEFPREIAPGAVNERLRSQASWRYGVGVACP